MTQQNVNAPENVARARHKVLATFRSHRPLNHHAKEQLMIERHRNHLGVAMLAIVTVGSFVLFVLIGVR